MPDPVRDESAAVIALPAPTSIEGDGPALLWRVGRGVALATVGAALATRAPYVLRTLGIAILVVAAGELLPPLTTLYPFVPRTVRLRGRELALASLARRLFPPALLLVVSCALLWPCLLGRMPTWQDHPIHLTKAWYFLTHLLRRGRIDGWMDYWFYGQPAETLYPPLSDYWLALLKVLTLGLASWEHVYAWGFVLMYFLCALAVYLFAARSLGRGAALLAALGFLLDRGEYREGGYWYTVYWGVWPQIFATGFLFLAIGKLEEVIDRLRPRDVVACAALVALALLGHPMNLVVLALALPALLVARIATDARPLGSLLVRTVVALGLGLLLAAYWVVPFAGSAAYAAHYGDVWKSVPDMARELFAGGIFQYLPSAIVVLAVGGAVAGFLARRVAPIFCALLALGLLFASSTTAFNELRLLDLSPSFGQIQYQRLAIPVKVAIFVLAGYGLAAIAEGARRLRDAAAARTASSAARRLPLLVALGLVVAPFVVPAAQSFGALYLPGLGSLETRAQIGDWRDYQKFLGWMRAERAASHFAADGPGYFRVAFVGAHDVHFFADAPVYDDLPAYKVGFTPASNFLYKPEDADPALYKTMSVKWIVSRGGGGGPYPVEKRFGDIVVQRFPGYDPARAHLEGAGHAEVKVLSPEHWQVTVTGAAADSRLVFHSAYFPSWHVYEAGKQLPITRTPASLETPDLRSGIHDYDFLVSVPAHDGLVDLVYQRRAVDWIGDLLTWLALAVILFLFLPGARIARWRGRLAPSFAFCERHGVLLLTSLVALAGLGLVARAAIARHGRYLLHEHFDAGPAHASLLVETESASGVARPCTDVRDGQVHCSMADWNKVGLDSDRFDGAFHECVLAHPVDRGEKLVLRFFHVPLGRTLRLEDGLTDSCIEQAPGGAPVTIDVAVDGTPIGSDTRPNEKGWFTKTLDTTPFAGGHHELDFRVTSNDNVMRYFCFDAESEGR